MATTTDQGQLALTKEVFFGVTPATPPFDVARIAGESIAFTQKIDSPGELSAARSAADVAAAGGESSGTIQFELAANTVFEDLLAALIGGAWASNAVSEGWVNQSFTVEKKRPGSGGTYCQRFAGVVPTKLALDVTAAERIKGSWDVIGGGVSSGSSPIAGATYAAPSPALNLAPGMHAGRATVALGGNLASALPLATATLTSLEIDAQSAMRHIISSDYPSSVRQGQLAITGKIAAYFEGNAPLTDALAETEGSLTITLVDATTTPNQHTYTMTLNRVRLEQPTALLSAPNEDLMAEFNFRAEQPAAGNQIDVTRATA